jgi:uncharacterized protein (TIGR03086 family)
VPVATEETTGLAERAGAHALEVLADINGVDLSRPTPCPDWDLRRLLLHVADAAAGLAGLVTTDEPHSSDRSAEQEHPALLAQADVGHLLEVLTTGDGSDDRIRQAAYGAAIELTAHAWDVEMTRSHAARLPTSLADDVHALATTLITDDTRSPHFGPRVHTPPDSPSGDRLMGFLGRDPSWPDSP